MKLRTDGSSPRRVGKTAWTMPLRGVQSGSDIDERARRDVLVGHHGSAA